jgi:hypothetical protein
MPKPVVFVSHISEEKVLAGLYGLANSPLTVLHALAPRPVPAQAFPVWLPASIFCPRFTFEESNVAKNPKATGPCRYRGGFSGSEISRSISSRMNRV